MESVKQYDGLEIAIIGMAGQFPQSDNCREFWKNLKEGKELIRTLTDEELRASGVPEESLHDKRYVKTAGYINNKEFFDAGFFGYSSDEASLMDPQIRLFHQYCWSALGDAGYVSLIDKYKIGMYAGAACGDNWKMYAHSKAEHAAVDPFFLRMIIAERFISTLASYKLNLRGPSMYVDTACSTSLLAVHLACRSLLTRECSIALAGGISVKTVKRKGYFYEEGMVSSSDGHCRTFDAQASGTASGEGAGIVVLKKLSEAIKDRDHIYAVIKATAANNDGNGKVGFTAPSVKGQADCIKMAIKLAGVDPKSISYIEAHGTATRLGDPVEIRALNEAFGVGGKEKYCAIGSVKSNMGHLDAAAGVAGLIKAVLSLQHKQIPASLHFNEPNPEIDFDSGPFYVNTGLAEWKRMGNMPMRAGVSSLGIGGTNVHVVLEEAPVQAKGDLGRAYKLLTVSGKTAGALQRNLHDLKTFLVEESKIDLADLSYTLQTGRRHFVYRKAVAYKDREELINWLETGHIKEQVIRSKENSRIVFMFSAAGSQYVNMGKELYYGEPVFREEMDKGFDLLKKLTGEDYKVIFYPTSSDDQRINNMLHTQPAIFLFEYSLARLMMSYGIAPDYMIGHSIGEYAAACLSGVFSYEDAVKLVVKRGELMNSLQPGAMLSAQLSEDNAAAYLCKEVSLAAVNGHDQVVFSGSEKAIQELTVLLENKVISCIKLHATHAGHSYMMDDILEPFREALKSVSMNAPLMPFVSGVTGKFISPETCTSIEYWVRHMRETVRFSDGISTIADQKGEMIYIEIGGSNSLTSLLKQRNLNDAGFVSVNLIKHPKETANDSAYLADRFAQLWTLGLNPDWNKYYQTEKRKKVSLPTYSFEQEKYPAEVDPFENGFAQSTDLTEITTKQGLKDWIYYPSWKRAVLCAPIQEEHVRRYILFSFDKAFAGRVKEELTKNSNELVEVFIGEKYEKIAFNQFVINPANEADYAKLFAELQSINYVFTDIIYSWSIGVNPSDIELTEENIEINLAWLSVVRIVQALRSINALDGKRMVFITDSLYKVMGTEQVNYGQALLSGLIRNIPQEFSIPCQNIDIQGNGDFSRLVKDLATEITLNEKEPIVALRHGQRWLQDFQKHEQPLYAAASVIREGGVYLITGGLGNVGFTIAKYLIQKYNARVVLIGRRDILKDEYPDGEGNEERWNRFMQLKYMSEQVRYYPADVADLTALQKIVNEVEFEYGAIHGIIHAAGVTDKNYFGFIEDTDAEKTFSMFASKVKGIECLYKIFKNKTPDFVWLTSSLSTVLGGLGYCSYASANAYMDHFVISKTNELPAWKCVILGELIFSKKSIEREHDLHRTGMKAEELIELFEWSLSVNRSPVILQSTGNLLARIKRSGQETKEISVSNAGVLPVINKHERPTLSTVYVEATTETEKMLQQIFENFMGIDQVGVEDHFFELGGDSLKGMMLLKRISNEFNISLALKDFLFNPTIRSMAAKIDEGIWFNTDLKMENEITI